MKHVRSWLEIFLLYVVPPIFVLVGVLPKVTVIPILWLLTFYAWWQIRHSDIALLRLNFTRDDLRRVFLRFGIFFLLMLGFILLYRPELFLHLPRTKPYYWLAIFLLYPILSAYTQELLFRSFFFERFKALYAQHPYLLASVNVLLFSYVHIVFENWIAMVFTLVGGVLFAHTYLTTRSTTLVTIEHALYGNALYTLGYGNFFYHNGH
jgi:uncharacterized protein